MISGQTRITVLHYAFLLTLIYFAAFFKLGSFPFRFWDESMFAVNAYEMNQNGNYMVPYFDGEVDWRNSKPLLLTWIQVGFIKLFGFSEWTIRLPSALAVAGSVLMLFHFLRTKVNSLYAWIAALILLTSPGFITLHTGRTGDADALLSFFLLATFIFSARWIMESNVRHLCWALVFFSFAVLTKSFAAFLFLPAIAGYGIYHHRTKIITIFKSGYFYAGSAALLLSLFVVFYLREHYQPGYLDYTFSNDAGRMGKVIELHAQGWDFYLEHIFNTRFSFWTVPFFIGALLLFKIEDAALRAGAVFVLVLIVTYLFILSLSTTKLLWYDMPLYPLLAAIAALPLYVLLSRYEPGSRKWGLPLAIVILFFIPYRRAFFEAQSNRFSYGDRVAELTSIFLFDQLRHGKETDLAVYHHGYKGSVLCYKYRYADRGKHLRITYTPDFAPGENVFVSNDSLKSDLLSRYAVDTLSVFESGLVVVIR